MSHDVFDNPFRVDRVNSPADYIAEWDVQSIGRALTDALLDQVEQVRASPDPDPGRKIQLMLGPPGYGKTHLLARLHRCLGDGIQFVFVAAPPQVMRVLEYAAWVTVETLYRSAHSFAPIRFHLARLLAPSFGAYFDQLPDGLKAKSSEIRASLEADPLVVHEILGPVDELAPYHRLADHLRGRLPNVQAAVLRALVLSLSPGAEDARWWLRGEAGQISDDRLAELRLPKESPNPTDVITGVAELLRLAKTPFVLVFDQLDILLREPEYGPAEFIAQLMGWLNKIPNIVIALSCLDDAWQEAARLATLGSFLGRIQCRQLDPPLPDEAIDLIERRMKFWSDFDPVRGKTWPFDAESIRKFVAARPVQPRGFINHAANLFNDWLAKKRPGTIRFDGVDSGGGRAELFGAEWAKLLEETKHDLKPAYNCHPTELWAPVEEALAIAKLGGCASDGMTIAVDSSVTLAANKSDPRTASIVTIGRNGKQLRVLVTVCKTDGGNLFGGWVNRLNAQLGKSADTGVVVWPKAQLSVGQSSQAFKNYKTLVTNGSLREFPLDQNQSAFTQLECLGRLTQRAKAGDLVIDGKPVSLDDCRKLIVETNAISKLKLFEHVFENWPALGSMAAKPGSAPAAPPPPPLTAPDAKPSVSRSADEPTAGPGAEVPKPEPTWAEDVLAKAVNYLKKRGQEVELHGADVGPAFVRLKVELRGDADFAKVKKQEKNLKLNLQLEHEPLIQAQAGFVSIDVQRPDRQTVQLPPLLAQCPPKFADEPAFPVGVGVSGNVEWLNLSEPESCHILVAGTTGSGKSEFLKAMLAALAARMEPTRVRFRLIDPKRVTFNIDAKCPYLGVPVVYNGEEAIPVLEECSEEMERRYKLLQKRGLDHVRNLAGEDAVPRWVVVMDEFADLMTTRATQKELEPLLQRLGAKARAAGIHLILGTQRPEAKVVTPLLRSNLPGKIGLQVGSERESKLFLDAPDAAYLFGKGDLVWKRGAGLVRLQSPFVSKVEFDKYLRVG